MVHKSYTPISPPRTSNRDSAAAGLPSTRATQDVAHRLATGLPAPANRKNRSNATSGGALWNSSVSKEASQPASTSSSNGQISSKGKVPGLRWTRKSSGNHKNKDDDVTWEQKDVEPLSERYSTDVAAHLKENRQIDLARRANLQNVKRDRAQVREEKKRYQRENEVDKDHSHVEEMRLTSRVGKNSVAYNPINHAYASGDAGKQLQRADQVERLRLEKRGREQYLRENSYNPVTGQDLKYFETAAIEA